METIKLVYNSDDLSWIIMSYNKKSIIIFHLIKTKFETPIKKFTLKTKNYTIETGGVTVRGYQTVLSSNVYNLYRDKSISFPFQRSVLKVVSNIIYERLGRRSVFLRHY